ncbi:UNVERIFIED_CONTAM: Auxin response factor 11 [Sesamum indicum]
MANRGSFSQTQQFCSFSSEGSGGKDALYGELWKACAGPLVDVPKKGERVYYFPQGHMEQAEQDTDEVYAQITLMPEADDMTQQTPTQELIAKDLHGTEWHFKHIFRGQPRRHLLTTGWSTFVTSKRLVAGDSFVFLRFSGTIVGVEDISPHWKESKWRSLKVQMQGVAVGRAVDLTILKGYDDLITELEEMFEIKGELRPRNKWEIVFTDDEGDMMLMGDDPWPEFCNMVRRIFICSSQDVKKMKGGKLPLPTAECEGTGINLENLAD